MFWDGLLKPGQLKGLTGPNRYTSKKQYPLKPEAKAGLQLLIDKFLKHGILKAANLLKALQFYQEEKPNGRYGMVQDSGAVMEAVVPIHFMAPNPSAVLTQVPGDTSWLTALQEDTACFRIPFANSPYLL